MKSFNKSFRYLFATIIISLLLNACVKPEFLQGQNLIEAILDSPDPQLRAVQKYRLALLHPNDELSLQNALTIS